MASSLRHNCRECGTEFEWEPACTKCLIPKGWKIWALTSFVIVEGLFATFGMFVAIGLALHAMGVID